MVIIYLNKLFEIYKNRSRDIMLSLRIVVMSSTVNIVHVHCSTIVYSLIKMYVLWHT